MKKSLLLCLSLAAAWMNGCGSSEVSSLLNNNPSVASSGEISVSGRVLSESGDPQSGVRIIANERTSDAKVETLSGSDGSFQVKLPTGVYDIGLDREGDLQTATCYYGPVPLNSDQRRDLILRSSNGKPAGTVFGKLFLQPGVPADKRKVNLRSAHYAGPNTPPSQSFTTGSDGSFEQVLPSEGELGVDIEVFDSQTVFDEFIDIHKRKKPAYVEFATELPVPTNRLRSDETDPPSQNNLRAKEATPVAASSFAQFNKLQSVSGGPGNPNNLLFSEGLLPVDNIQRSYFDGENDTRDNTATGLMTFPVALQFNAYRGYVVSGKIRIAKNGSWFLTYAINIDPEAAAYYEFTDQTGDIYRLHVFIAGLWGHKVSYNSSQPAIKAMATVDPLYVLPTATP